jgi:shikimate kinase
LLEGDKVTNRGETSKPAAKEAAATPTFGNAPLSPCHPVTLSPCHERPGATSPGRELIALIGPRGSGKTTVARVLAELLGWGWADADEELERRAGRPIRAVFAEVGEPGFRERESAVLRELCALRRHVVATGGGAVLREENRILLRESAMVVWLSADAETLRRRLERDPTTPDRRPALLGGGRDEMGELLRVREPLYRACADRAVSTAGRTPHEVAAAIAAHLAEPQPSRE